MIQDILNNSYYGNTVLEWFTALCYVLIAVIIGKIIYWIFKNHIKKLAEKTKSKWDDVIVDLIEEPIVIVLTLIGINMAIQSLNFSDSTSNFIARAFTFGVIFAVAWAITRLIDAFVKDYLAPLSKKSTNDLDDQLIPVIRRGSKIIIWIIAIIVALDNAGYDVTALIAGLGVGGLAIALAAKDLLENIFGGITIFSDKPFRKNDRIKVLGYDGKISEVGIRSTRMKTLEGREVIFPNRTFIHEPIENVTKEPDRKVKFTIGVTYNTKPAKIEQGIKIVKDIIKKNKNTNNDDFMVEFTTFGDFALGILVIYYIHNKKEIFPTQTAINLAIHKEFAKAKIDMAFPTQTIHLKK